MATISEVKVWPRTGGGKALANAQFTYDGAFKIRCTLWAGGKGPFVGFPGNYGNKTDENGKKIFYPDISCLKDEVKAELNEAIVVEYNKAQGNDGMNQGEGSGPTSQESTGKKNIPF